MHLCKSDLYKYIDIYIYIHVLYTHNLHSDHKEKRTSFHTKDQPPTTSAPAAAATAGAVRPGAAQCQAGAPEGTGAAAKLQRFSGTTRAASAAKQGGGTMAWNQKQGAKKVRSADLLGRKWMEMDVGLSVLNSFEAGRLGGWDVGIAGVVAAGKMDGVKSAGCDDWNLFSPRDTIIHNHHQSFIFSMDFVPLGSKARVPNAWR